MEKKIKISKIIEAIDLQSEDYPPYFNFSTYEIEYPIQELDKECPWAKNLKTILEIEYDENYLLLPTKYDFFEHQVMVEFSKKQPIQLSKKLLDVLHKKDAFKNFRILIDRFYLESSWYKFRDEKLIQLAISWCNNNNIDFEL